MKTSVCATWEPEPRVAAEEKVPSPPVVNHNQEPIAPAAGGGTLQHGGPVSEPPTMRERLRSRTEKRLPARICGFRGEFRIARDVLVDT